VHRKFLLGLALVVAATYLRLSLWNVIDFLFLMADSRRYADMPMINYKIATSTYKVVTFSQPPYLTHLLALYTPGRSLRSQDKHLLLEPAVSTVIGSRGFSYAAPSLSNYLPVEIRNSSLFASFKRNAETYYFPVPSLRPAPRHPPPSDCPLLRSGLPADHARVTTDFHSAPIGSAKYCDERVCLSVCLSVCLYVHYHISGTTRPIFSKFFCVLPMVVARSSSGGVVICYVFPVLWMTSYLHIN